MSMLSAQSDELRKHAERLRQLANGAVNQGFPARQDLYESAAEMHEAAGTVESLQDALRRACQFIAGYGSCPYDTFDLYEPWEESCYQKCSADIDRAECWQKYFESGDDSR